MSASAALPPADKSTPQACIYQWPSISAHLNMAELDHDFTDSMRLERSSD